MTALYVRTDSGEYREATFAEVCERCTWPFPLPDEPINQCDGCQYGLPVNEFGNHRDTHGFFSCTANRYKAEPVKDAPAAHLLDLAAELWAMAQGPRPIEDAEAAIAARVAEFMASEVPADRTTPPDGFALVPLKLTRRMSEVLENESWAWADLLAAADAVTEEQYDEAVQATPADRKALAEEAKRRVNALAATSMDSSGESDVCALIDRLAATPAQAVPSEQQILTAAKDAGLLPKAIQFWMPAMHRYHAALSKSAAPSHPEQGDAA